MSFDKENIDLSFVVPFISSFIVGILIRIQRKSKPRIKESMRTDFSKSKNTSNKHPRKNPSPFIEFLDPVSQEVQWNRVELVFTGANILIADLLLTFVRSLATPDKPWQIVIVKIPIYVFQSTGAYERKKSTKICKKICRFR